jgi:glutathione synthase/RimK-type ligase-like ATP-grasp enzyme
MSSAPPRRVGLLVGRENTFPQPFLDTVNRKGRERGVTAELALLQGTQEEEEPAYAVLVDRISHEVPYYRAHLKSAVLMGTVAVNDPFWWQADEKFFECTLARKLGVAVPRTVVLPNKDYIPDIDTATSLRNLRYPLDWEAILRYTGLPAVLKPNVGGGWKDVHVVDSLDELIAAYDRSGQKTMILQQFIDWDDYLRCICIGREHILPIRYNPKAEFMNRYVIDRPPEPELRRRAEAEATTLVQALGYDMDTVEFAIKDGVLYAIDFLNPAPDFDNFSIKEESFAWVLEKMSDLVIRYALGEAAPPWRRDHRWWKYVERTAAPAT